MREDKHQFYMKMAHLVATRSTCMKRQVGAVLVQNNRIISTGYNGSPSGFDHCIDKDKCLREGAESGSRLEECMAIHAEANCILQLGITGTTVLPFKAELYVTTYPCSTCSKMLANLRIREIFYDSEYPSTLSYQILSDACIAQTRLEVK